MSISGQGGAASQDGALASCVGVLQRIRMIVLLPSLYPLSPITDVPHDGDRERLIAVNRILEGLLSKDPESFWMTVIDHLEDIQQYLVSLFTQRASIQAWLLRWQKCPEDYLPLWEAVLRASFLFYVRLSNPIVLPVSREAVDFDAFEKEEQSLFSLEVSGKSHVDPRILYDTRIVSLPHLLDFTGLFYAGNEQLVSTTLYRFSKQYTGLLSDMQVLFETLLSEDFVELDILTVFCNACPWLIFVSICESLSRAKSDLPQRFLETLFKKDAQDDFIDKIWDILFSYPLFPSGDESDFALSLIDPTTAQKNALRDLFYAMVCWMLESLEDKKISSFIERKRISDVIVSIKAKDDPVLEYLVHEFRGLKPLGQAPSTRKDKEDVFLDSKVSNIIDLFPDMSQEDVISVLERCGMELDKAIQWILEHPGAKPSAAIANPLATGGKSGRKSKNDRFSWKEVLDDKSSIMACQERLIEKASLEEQEKAIPLEQDEEMNRLLSGLFAPHVSVLVDILQRNPDALLLKNRKGKEREELIKKTRLTHEQLEGWYIMYTKLPPHKQSRVIQKYMDMLDSDSTSEEAAPASGSQAGRSQSRTRYPRSKNHHRKDRATQKLMKSVGGNA